MIELLTVAKVTAAIKALTGPVLRNYYQITAAAITMLGRSGQAFTPFFNPVLRNYYQIGELFGGKETIYFCAKLKYVAFLNPQTIHTEG
jgi:hypothetical protein